MDVYLIQNYGITEIWTYIRQEHLNGNKELWKNWNGIKRNMEKLWTYTQLNYGIKGLWTYTRQEHFHDNKELQENWMNQAYIMDKENSAIYKVEKKQ